MRLDEVTAGSIYVDVNVFYMYLRRDPAHLPTIRTFLRRMVRGILEVHTAVLTFDELFYRLLLAKVREEYGCHPIEVLREGLTEPIARCAGPISSALRRMARFPHLHRVGVEETDFEAMLRNITDFLLLPRDALHIAVMQRLGLKAMASDDADFDRVPWLERHWVFNPPSEQTQQSM